MGAGVSREGQQSGDRQKAETDKRPTCTQVLCIMTFMRVYHIWRWIHARVHHSYFNLEVPSLCPYAPWRACACTYTHADTQGHRHTF